MKTPTLYIVVPCYNEEECIETTSSQLSKKLSSLIKKEKISKESKVVFIDDGSKDRTWPLIKKLPDAFIGIKLSRNRGHQNALLAGLMYAKDHADICISIDADLQDDTDAIDKMITEYANGAEIVYGVRSDRKTDTWFKRTTAQSYYKFLSALGVDVVYNSADYRCMSKRTLEELSKYPETNLFLRGITPTLGFKTATVEYSRHERIAGESKYPLKKMLGLAWDGVTSFSVKPIRLILNTGILILFVSIAVILYSVIQKILGNTVSGWTFVICSIWIIGGLQLFAIGIIGEYIGKTYMETKNRPRYIIEEIHQSK